MARFYSVVWQDGSFDNTASVLAFNSKAARAAYPAQSAMRVQEIDFTAKTAALREGRKQTLMLWDASEPAKFVPVLY